MQSIDAVDYGLSQIPEVYRKGVWDNIVKHKAYPSYADRSTYGRYKSKFVYCVAEKLGLISYCCNTGERKWCYDYSVEGCPMGRPFLVAIGFLNVINLFYFFVYVGHPSS